MKKILMLTLAVSCLCLLTGCGKEETKKENKNEITYTNKYECSKSKEYTKTEYDTLRRGNIKENSGEEDTTDKAVESTTTRIYDFNEDGSKVLAVYDITKYKYLIDYNMDDEKAYFNKECERVDKDKYKSCKVSIEDKTITLTSEVNIDSEYNIEYYGELKLNDLKESYASDKTYTCK